MKIKFSILLLIVAFSYVQAQDATTYYFVRHAEKQVDGTKNPHLTEEGKLRSTQWGKMLKNEKIDVIYSTDYFRTKETASGMVAAIMLPEKPKPGTNLGIKIKTYDPRNLDLPKFLEETHGKRVVIVGHSNTTPTFVNAILGEKKYEQIDESIYGHLYIVTVVNGKATATLIQTD